MYGFLTEEMIDEGDGRLGQRLPSPGRPVLFQPGMPFSFTPQAQASARGGAATAATVEVVAYVNGVEFQRGSVLLTQIDEARRILASSVGSGGFSFHLVTPVIQGSSPFIRSVNDVLQSKGSGYSLDVINRALAALGFRQMGYEIWPDSPRVQVRPRAQVRSRGGFATVFGLGAAGYALGGPAGACVGAACGLLLG